LKKEILSYHGINFGLSFIKKYNNNNYNNNYNNKETMAATMTETFRPSEFSLMTKDGISAKDYNNAVKELIHINQPEAGYDSDDDIDVVSIDLTGDDEMDSEPTAQKTNGKRRRAATPAFPKQNKPELPEIVVVSEKKEDKQKQQQQPHPKPPKKPPTRYAKRTTKTKTKRDVRPQSTSLRTITGLNHYIESDKKNLGWQKKTQQKERKGRSGPNMTLSPCREINGRGRVSACRSARAIAALKNDEEWLEKTCEYMRVYVSRVIMHQTRMDKKDPNYRQLTDKMVRNCEKAKNADQVFDQLVCDPVFISDYFDLMKEQALKNLTKDNMYRQYADDRNKAK
jgi:hypothetical protein